LIGGAESWDIAAEPEDGDGLRSRAEVRMEFTEDIGEDAEVFGVKECGLVLVGDLGEGNKEGLGKRGAEGTAEEAESAGALGVGAMEGAKGVWWHGKWLVFQGEENVVGVAKYSGGTFWDCLSGMAS
jgi:hypothetical protein